MSDKEYGNNPLYRVSLVGYVWQGGLKYTKQNLQNLHDNDMLLVIESNTRWGISAVMGKRYVKPDENKEIPCLNAQSV